MLPHGIVPPKQRRAYHLSQWSRSPLDNSSDMFGTSRFCFLALLIAIPSFLLGTTVSLYAGVDCSNKVTTTGSGVDDLVEKRVQELLKEREEVLLSKHAELVKKLVERGVKEELAKNPANGGAKGDDRVFLDPASVGNMAAAMVVTPKVNFTDLIDLGVPLDGTRKGSSHVLVLYSQKPAMPTALQQHCQKQAFVPEVEHVEEALENCEYLNVLLVDHSRSRKSCLALVPQYESYHLQKWMRVPERSNGFHGAIDPKEPLRLVSRGFNIKNNGKPKEEFPPPRMRVTEQAFSTIQTYLNSLDSVQKELQELIKKTVKPYNDKIIVVMVCNFGQSELLINFACHARSNNFDTSAVLVFATDQETADLARSVGLAAYYDERNFESMPSEAARVYGDAKFTAMMVAKIVCVQLISHLGYDFLFQDVDILWYKHPLSDYFAKPDHWSQKYDAIFQDDGGHSVRYTPYSANSGFYYVRHNDRTRAFLNTLLMSSDIILETDSHQQAMIAVLTEHVSLYGLRVKVVAREEEDMPGGYQWNMKSGKYMKAFFAGEIKPLIFHMSWTNNKGNKMKYFQQMGSWHVQEMCIGKKKDEISGSGSSSSSDLTSTCCSAEPIFKCHYSDKPSIHPCKDSPAIDGGKRKSFW